ncbi:MAG TPA: peptide deformylase [Verrucomicrobiae bacterium]
MKLPIVQYGHPVLRQKGARIEKITPEIEQLIQDMLDTMYHEKGVGLAAQQVGRALQLTVIDVREATDRPSTLELNGAPADPASIMPLVLINPEWKAVNDPVAGPEGCLSFPEIYADVSRPESIDVTAMNAKGEKIEFRAGGLLSRAVQHEYDHLHGVLFIDRMEKAALKKIKPELDGLVYSTRNALNKARRRG